MIALPLFVAATLLGCGKGNDSESAPDPVGTSPENVRAQRESARIFISGHSLVDQPLPDFVARIGGSLRTPVEWNRQYVEGSAILRRVRGKDPQAQGFAGYREGLNREGKNLDVVSELRRPQTVQGGTYDVLLITEQHGMLETLLRNETVRYLRHYHDRFIAGNPNGTTYFYESWLDIDDKSDPRRWIAYERAASPIWQCMATRVNVSLRAEGRADRITSLPAGVALAELLARSTGGAKLEGISLGSDADTVNSLVDDRVHLTPLGAYYISLVTYSSIFQRSPVGAWAPDGVTPLQAKSLQETAWKFVSEYYARYQPLSLAACRALLRDSMIDHYWTYVRDVQWKPHIGTVHAYLRWVRRVREWQATLARDDSQNPLHFDPATDRGYWLPPP